MISLKRWYHRYTKLPLLLVVVAIAVLQLSYLIALMWQNKRQYRELSDNIVQVTGVALQQKNRLVLESLVFSISKNPNFREFYLCEYEETLLAYPATKDGCKNLDRVGRQYDEFIIPGFKGMKIRSSAPLLKLPSGILFVGAATLLLSLVAILILITLAKKFEQSILNPILNDFSLELPQKIEEFESLKRRRAQVLALERGRALADLASQVAHDIRSPISLLSMLVAKKGDRVGENEWALISSATERITKIADNLLASHRNVQRRSSLRDLVTIASKVVEEKRIVRNRGNIHLESRDISPSEVAIAEADWGRVVAILVDNACDSSDVDADIHVRLHGQTDRCVLECIDSGQGMPPDVLKRVQRLEGSFKVDGNGLGLRFVDKVVTLASGGWSITSQPNAGTVVTIVLPLGKQHSPENSVNANTIPGNYTA